MEGNIINGLERAENFFQIAGDDDRFDRTGFNHRLFTIKHTKTYVNHPSVVNKKKSLIFVFDETGPFYYSCKGLYSATDDATMKFYLLTRVQTMSKSMDKGKKDAKKKPAKSAKEKKEAKKLKKAAKAGM